MEFQRSFFSIRILPQFINPVKIDLLVTFFLLITPTYLFGQLTTVNGIVRDAKSDEVLEFVHVVFEGSSTGTTTDSLGEFSLKTDRDFERIVVSFMGYKSQVFEIETGQDNHLEVILQAEEFALDEILVQPDDGPVRRLLQKVQENIERNNPDNLGSYSYQRYSRWEYQINNVTDRMRNWRIFRDAQGAFQYADDSTRFLPVYFSEQLVSNQFQKDPRRQLSIIEADHTRGLGMLEDSEIAGVTAGLEGGVNVYDPSIKFLGHNFISPLAPNGWFYYDYYLLDSIKTESGYDQLVRFVPKRRGDNTLRGEMLIEDNFYSVREVNAKLSNTAHLNFIKHLSIDLSYQLVDDSIPFFSNFILNTVVDYSPIETRKDQRVELKAIQHRSYSNVQIGLEEEVKLSHRNLTYESQRVRDWYSRGEDYWEGVRPADLSDQERLFMAAIDSVNQLGFVRFLDNIAQMAITGYYDFGKWELGPYDYLINFNEVQGTHLFLGGRTGRKISENFSIWGGVGYGTRNKKWIGRLGAGYLFPSPRRTIMKAEYTDDIIQVGENERILLLYENKQHSSESNLLSHILKRRIINELHQRQRLRIVAEREIRTGFNVSASASLLRMHSPEFYPFLNNDQPVNNFEGAEVGVNFRWSWEEKFFDHGFRRLYLGTPHPIVNLSLSLGMTQVGRGSEPFSRVHASVKHHFFTGQARLNYALEGGLVFGAVPYPLLDMPRANQTYGFQTYNFNMVNAMEFLHDRYIRVYAEYRLNGFLFNRIPLVRSLNLREVISFKGFVGGLDERHRSLLDLPLRLAEGNTQPYGELGFGVENLFRFFRVDAIWRATHQWDSSPIGIRLRMEIRI
ncbi:MAG: carboxypeptidase-like regulatory domain-containing protein [Saprospirales bacterium]|nr:MAG: carboxypeptidase-like regulatory domain-containing protein [Saprospirales bacterium]